MHVITVRNVHDALPAAIQQLPHIAYEENSRNGPVYVARTAVSTVYQRPFEKVLFWSQRDANPFFHFFESLWMIAGRRDVEFPARFSKQISQYSDDGINFHGGYGHRWRSHFDSDQLPWIAARLRENPNDRRAVLTMWDPDVDIPQVDANGKDVPCNTQAFFRIVQQGDRKWNLDMQVNCRSNDILWGAYGANAVHFAFLQEYLADKIGEGTEVRVQPGTYTQMSFNWHAYADFFRKMMARGTDGPNEMRLQDVRGSNSENPYAVLALHRVKPCLIGADAPNWDRTLNEFLHNPGPDTGLDFFDKVAWPLYYSYTAYKAKQYDVALRLLDGTYGFSTSGLQALDRVGGFANLDWFVAGRQWLNRRLRASQKSGVSAEGV